ncbi:MAG: hypothetical protein A3F83_10640 [Candidatus Glassbacteria bacterium RIFCSPLOWO2_12_FULL_58_11]|uniref:Tyr recombinase domain-containing protein n=1 Tax=Candidatus Glassbacteria bacterium RIFCSPLOWO2_12_FULL_58_11 TaxID=1817867 RepID=A0A1F5YQ99_9BACT|nr:MAG: hypothetical protein A3F83_10640 [Candidatus Glassbacteria bacterium RIFCSPLOWO2_12_FULL_58_11]
MGLKAEDGSKLRFHDLRHYRASFWSAAGASLEDIQVGLGHENRATTERYITADVAAVGQRLNQMKRPRLKGL